MTLILNSVTAVLIHLTIIRRFSWPSLAHMCINVPLAIKGCKCHKWQIHPFISKGTPSFIFICHPHTLYGCYARVKLIICTSYNYKQSSPIVIVAIREETSLNSTIIHRKGNFLHPSWHSRGWCAVGTWALYPLVGIAGGGVLWVLEHFTRSLA